MAAGEPGRDRRLSYPTMSPEQQVAWRAALAQRHEETLALARRLVGVNSHSRHRAGLLENAAIIRAAFEPLGFQARQVPDEDPERGDHLLLRRGDDGAPAIALVSHLDTVYRVEQERQHDFRWREADGFIYGPGVADIKGGTALIWSIVAVLAGLDRARFDRVAWQILFNAAEEEGNATFPRLVRETLPARTLACLVYEPGNPDPLAPQGSCVTSSRRGSARYQVECFGREAHAGAAHAQGANAIRQLARLIERIEAMTDHARGLTCNAGVIGGGHASNTVPGHAWAQVDTRAETPAEQASQHAALLALAGDGDVVSVERPYRCRVEVRRSSCYPPWPEGGASQRLAAEAVMLAAECGIPLRAERRAGASDANHLWELAPTLCSLGPVGRNIHCAVHDPTLGLAQESIDPNSLLPRGLLSLALIDRLLDQAGVMGAAR